MSYEIVYGQGAIEQLLRVVTRQHVDCFDAAMRRLAGDPGIARQGQSVVELHGRVYRPQEYVFRCGEHPGGAVRFQVDFLFDETEHQLQVIGVTSMPSYLL
jgi:hypothetical protein